MEGYGKVLLGEGRTDDSRYIHIILLYGQRRGTVGAAARHSRGCTRLIYLRVDTKAQDGSLLPLRLPYLQLRAAPLPPHPPSPTLPPSPSRVVQHPARDLRDRVSLCFASSDCCRLDELRPDRFSSSLGAHRVSSRRGGLTIHRDQCRFLRFVRTSLKPPRAGANFPSLPLFSLPPSLSPVHELLNAHRTRNFRT